jgi:hypothetical protein
MAPDHRTAPVTEPGYQTLMSRLLGGMSIFTLPMLSSAYCCQFRPNPRVDSRSPGKLLPSGIRAWCPVSTSPSTIARTSETAFLRSCRSQCRPQSARIQPSFERRLAFTRGSSHEKIFYVDVFINRLPVNPAALGDQAPAFSLVI